jgi:hypothetical protein
MVNVAEQNWGCRTEFNDGAGPLMTKAAVNRMTFLTAKVVTRKHV